MEAREIGNKIKELMKAKKMTEKQLAKEMGINIKTLTKKLSGKQEFYATEIIAITKIFELDIKKCAEIFFGEDKN